MGISWCRLVASDINNFNYISLIIVYYNKLVANHFTIKFFLHNFSSTKQVFFPYSIFDFATFKDPKIFKCLISDCFRRMIITWRHHYKSSLCTFLKCSKHFLKSTEKNDLARDVCCELFNFNVLLSSAAVASQLATIFASHKRINKR